MPADTSAAVERLLQFLAVEGVTGREADIGRAVEAALEGVGVTPGRMIYDDAHSRIPLPTQTGNLIVKLPGHGRRSADAPLLFMTHLDTVPLCAGARPRRAGDKIINEAPTALGGDNRTGCAVLVSLAAELLRHKPDHPPLTLLFTVREESGLFGARYLDPASLGPVAMGFNFDGKLSSDVILGAVGADRWEVEIHGRASHAGVHPDRGVSATLILALALADVHRNGWFGKVAKGGKLGTSNVGSVGDKDGRAAGEATNVVTDYVHVRGESRSHDPAFVSEITAAYEVAFATAAAAVTDHEGEPGTVTFVNRPDYHPFRLPDDAPVVQRATTAVRSLGLNPALKVTNGGLDANWMVRHGVPVVTLGAGQQDIHTVKEWVDLPEFENAVRLAYALATG